MLGDRPAAENNTPSCGSRGGDATAPTITITTPPDGASYTLHQAVNADYECTDEAGGSGLASCVGTVANGTAIDTSTVGSKTIIVTATDNAGNSTSITNEYQVVNDFAGTGGFPGPVNNPPVVNTAKAGQIVPVQWQLPDGQGGFFCDLSLVTGLFLQQVNCGEFMFSPTDPVETAGNRGLRCDNGQYI